MSNYADSNEDDADYYLKMLDNFHREGQEISSPVSTQTQDHDENQEYSEVNYTMSFATPLQQRTHTVAKTSGKPQFTPFMSSRSSGYTDNTAMISPSFANIPPKPHQNRTITAPPRHFPIKTPLPSAPTSTALTSSRPANPRPMNPNSTLEDELNRLIENQSTYEVKLQDTRNRIVLSRSELRKIKEKSRDKALKIGKLELELCSTKVSLFEKQEPTWKKDEMDEVNHKRRQIMQNITQSSCELEDLQISFFQRSQRFNLYMTEMASKIESNREEDGESEKNNNNDISNKQQHQQYQYEKGKIIDRIIYYTAITEARDMIQQKRDEIADLTKQLVEIRIQSQNTKDQQDKILFDLESEFNKLENTKQHLVQHIKDCTLCRCDENVFKEENLSRNHITSVVVQEPCETLPPPSDNVIQEPMDE